jgi:hypothetical protein
MLCCECLAVYLPPWNGSNFYFIFFVVDKCLSIPVNPSYFHNRQTDRDVVEPHIHIVGPRAHVNTSLQASLIRSRLCVVKSDSPRWWSSALSMVDPTRKIYINIT